MFTQNQDLECICSCLPRSFLMYKYSKEFDRIRLISNDEFSFEANKMIYIY